MAPLLIRLGLRFARTRHQTRFISFISFVSVFGIAIGITVLITVLSIMNGFQNELQTRILNVVAHAVVHAENGAIDNWRAITRTLSSAPHITSAMPLIDENGLLYQDTQHRSAGGVQAVRIFGIDPDEEATVVSSPLPTDVLQQLTNGNYGIVLGMTLAQQLRVGTGDVLRLIVPRSNFSLGGITPRMRQVTVVGIFSAGMAEYDAGLAYMHLNDIQRLYRYGDAISAIQLRTNDIFSVKEPVHNAIRTVRSLTKQRLFAVDWTQQHSNFFRALALEKRMMFLVIAMIIAVAAFNIAASMVMSVNEKRRDIAILRTLGLTRRHIVCIFFVQGMSIGIVGTVLGTIGGILVAGNIETIIPALEHLFSIRFFPPDVYYISDIPSYIVINDIVITATSAFIFALIATLYPAWYGARIEPAEALRYD